MAECTCSGERDFQGELLVTVGCRVHHVMACGAPAAEHEVSCMCSNFVDVCECALFVDTEDEDGGDEPFYVCGECRPWVDRQTHLVAAKTEQQEDDA